jgi:hypothetical protein
VGRPARVDRYCFSAWMGAANYLYVQDSYGHVYLAYSTVYRFQVAGKQTDTARQGLGQGDGQIVSLNR